MSYFEDEILKDIEINKEYTSRQVQIFLHENKDVVLISDRNNIVNDNKIKYRVIRRIDKYIHRISSTSRNHILPNNITRIYEIEQVD